MTKADLIIRDLLNALDTIQRADNIDYIKGAASFAIERANRACVRNKDGYLVAPQETAVDRRGSISRRADARRA